MDYYNVTVVIPSYDPGEKLMSLVNELLDNGFDDIVIVDDGSRAECRKNFPDPKKYPFCTVLSHRRNRGKGASLKTAFDFFVKNRRGKAGVITVNDDGQHVIGDIMACAEKMLLTEKIVLGCRNLSDTHLPKKSRIGNKITRFVFRLFCGLKISDTQTALRAIPTKHVEEFVDIGGSRYEYETNILLEIKKRQIDFIEMPIDTSHFDKNRHSHFRPIRDSLRIYKLILAFVFSSLISMGVELIVYWFLLQFFLHGEGDILWADLIARVPSSIVNFAINKNQVFDVKGSMRRPIFRYTLLAIPLALTSVSCIAGFSWLFGSENAALRTALKMPVDTTLFFVSFRFQQNWVFAPPKVKPPKAEGTAKPKRSVRKKIVTAVAILLAIVILAASALLVYCFAFVKNSDMTYKEAFIAGSSRCPVTKWIPNMLFDEAEIEFALQKAEFPD